MGFNPFMRSRRARSGPSNHSSQFEEDRSGTLETAAELAFQAFLQPYELNDLTITVQKLTASGYTSVEAVRGMDEKSATDLGLHDDDVEKVLLAAFLYGNELPQYGAGFVSIGCDTLLKAYVLSDEGLQQAGVRTIGHRRQLQRYLREDDRVITKLRRREEEKAAAAADAKKRLGGGMVGSAASTTPKRGLGEGLGGARASKGALSATSIDSAPPLRLLPTDIPRREPWERRSEEPASISTVPTTSNGSIHNWLQPWVTVNSSAIFGAPPGLRAEAHSLAPMPRDMHGNDRPVQLVSNDGKSVMEVW